jgi:two-component system, NarL family, sensor histidine kinase UhpB
VSLRLKLHLIVGALTLLFVAAVLALQLSAMRDSVREEVEAANRVAAQILHRTTMLYAAQGTPAMLAFLQGLGRVRSTEITLQDAGLRELYRSPPSPYKAGRDAPAWFAALIAPAPTRQAFEFSDGMLEMRSNASRAALDAWDASVLLLGGALAMLVALNLLLAWVLGRTVRPFGRIVEALGEVEAGRFDVTLPQLPGREAATMGAAFNRMVGELREHLETEKRALRAEAQLSDTRELTRWIDHHIEQERRAIAGELHDELGQSVTAMRSMALSVAQRTQASDPDAAHAARLVAEEASRLYDAMHGLIPRLTPLVLDRFGLADALADLAERTRRSHPQVQIDLDLKAGTLPLAPDAALALYRAGQEGITNALRHGGAERLRLTLLRDGGDVVLLVEDNGRGLAPDWAQRQGHHGLRWMAERVDALRGRFAIGPADPRGVRLSVSVPAEAVA